MAHDCNKDGEIGYIRAKVDEIHEEIHTVNVTLVQQHESLKEHMRRTEANEKHVEILEKQIKPIMNIMTWSKITAKIFVAGPLVSGCIYGILKIIDFLK